MKKVLVVVGPTGVGKTELSLDLAKKYQGEIISGDSIQVYKGLDIGSAKVSVAQQEEVVHHLIDAYDLDEPYDVALFQKEARRLIDEISERGKLPIIVGGTGLYINAVLKNYIFQEEEENPELDAKLEKMTNEALHQKLMKLDPESAKKLHVNNRQRVKRAIVIAKTTALSKSEIVQQQKDELLYDAHIISLTMPRADLYEKINERVLQMMDQGLYQEVEDLYQKYGVELFNFRGMRGIGYKEWKDHFVNGASIESVVAEIQKRSRNFAKRQYTWFNNQMDVDWFDISQEAYRQEIVESVEAWYHDEHA